MPTDILIIGAGINGLLSALSLAKAGLRVKILEQGDAAGESTWAGAGILSLLLPWNYDAPINTLSERGRALWPELAESLKYESRIDPEYWACGMQVIGNTDNGLAMEWCKRHDWTCLQSYTDGDVHIPPETSALWLPKVAQTRNPRAAKSAISACRNAGIEISTHLCATGFQLDKGRITAVTTPNGQFHADSYVVASGAWSNKLLERHAFALDIKPIRGQILLFKAKPGLLPHIIYSNGKYLVPRHDGHILVGSTLEDVGFEKASTQTAKEELLSFAFNVFPNLQHAQLIQQWAGLRPGSPGNLPTISRHPELENLYINSGHFRYGVTMAPASAELLRELVIGTSTTLEPKPYEWRRA